MRWKVVCVGLAAALAVTAGCKQQCFVSESDLNNVLSSVHCDLAKDPTVGSQPITDRCAAPPTIDNPDRKIRYISLAEAISIALEQGNVGSQQIASPSLAPYQDTEVSFTGGGVTSVDSIRVLALDPATVGANIDLALSKFDALWTTSLTWNNTDQPIGTAIQSFSNPGAVATEQSAASFNTALLKPLPTGGVAGITFNTDYTYQSINTNSGQRVNPLYQPSVQFEFEQPLLQGFGVEINQLRQGNPTSELLPNGGALGALPQPGVEGILITRIRFDQQRAEFQRNVNIMLANTEFAYWNLYNAYWNLYSQEAALRQAYEAWKIAEVKLQAGKIAVADVAQARGQYELFRNQRLAALGGTGNPASSGVRGVLEQERQLRGILNLPVEDGTRLVPSDAPTLAAFHPDWDTAQTEAMQNAPSLILVREQLKADQLNVRLAENALLPDLRAVATYDVNSIGSRLDGDNTGSTGNAFRNLASNGFNDSTLGLRLNVPLGYRNAYANVRIAKLRLARDYEALHTQELKIQRALGVAYQGVFVTYAEIKDLRAQREAFGDQVKANFQEFQAGKITPDVLLEAQRFWASALSQEYQAITDYNNSLAVFELVKGTIAQHDNVVIAEGPLPKCVAERAVEHQRQRSAALELHERAAPVPLAETHCDHPIADVPLGPDSHTEPLPELWKNMPPLKDAPPLPALTGAPAARTGAPAPAPWAPMPTATPVNAAPTAPDVPATPKKPSDAGAAVPERPTLAAPAETNPGLPLPALPGPSQTPPPLPPPPLPMLPPPG